MKLAAAVVLAVLLSACSPVADNDIERLALPVAASDRSQPVWDLWLGAWIAVLVVFVLVFGLIVYASVRYRRRSDDEIPTQVRYNLPLEALYTIAPVVVVAVFFFHTVTSQNEVLEEVENPDHTIQVVGSKWQWAFNYLDEQATQGEDVYDFGTPAQPAELWLPLGESVRFNLTSPDVIHSFWIPEFYFKMDVVPGRENSFDMTPTREGTFTGRCAELCGLYHSRMIFKVNVVSPEEYEAHLQDLVEIGQVGAPAGQKEADTVAGLRGEESGDESVQEGAGN
ncbi:MULTISPECIES: cytochrome c oxidase subunit II [unclassified Aeromicrobium]|uniref:aa3-type cytochrome oxidase subunit II n=1 Tax=unclassified Aeromicrobium TaxID=2633570 RepID=UPI0006F386F8|nr:MULTISPECIES: cytochrome c oxidase subunit II [unclassified Aeromicrobium]KQO37405.1 cytochrome B [Aeromicrobium sp. Leaf245]KQP26262.1 cytochrome B [Aeromicrobium sp. Leaf272]KQP75931.1 cytochrome B [Aeromicrobium sp. Leaf289]KQP84958.1 cytochrome B [Aeromicrobium sp. Leaf291]